MRKSSMCGAYATCWRGDCPRNHFSCLHAGERSLKKTTLVLIGTLAVRYVQKLGNTNGDRVCIERPHSLAKPEETIVQTGKFQFKDRDR